MDKEKDATDWGVEGDFLRRTLAGNVAAGGEWTLERPGVRGDRREDARVRLRLGRKTARFVAEVKRGVQKHNIGTIAHRMAGRADGLLVTDYVNPRLAEALRQRKVQFIDAAGNAYVDRPPFFVFVRGERPHTEARHEPRGRAFQPTALQVVFALICRPEFVDRPYREIAAEAGVAHGTVGWVLPELLRLGFVVEVAGRRRMNDVGRLITRWVDAYVNFLRPKLLFERYRGDDLHRIADLEGGRQGFLLGGEFAAARMTGHLKPETATFYGERPGAAVLAEMRLRRDPAGNVEFRRRFWRFDDGGAVVPPLLVYADLLAMGDERCVEAARLVQERYLARPR